MNKISKTHTSCKDCVFAEYIDNLQRGCGAKYLLQDTYPLDGVEFKHIYGSVVAAQDEEKDFYIVDNAYCYGKRKEKWGKRFPKDRWLDQLKVENQIFYQSIVFANDNLDDVKNTIASLLIQTIKPRHIAVVRPVNNKISPTDLINYLEGIGIKWKIQNIANLDLTDENIIDMIVSNDTFPYYSVFYAGFTVPIKFFSTISEKIYDNTLKFAILLPNSTNNGMVVSTPIHKIYGGNNEKRLLDKIKEDNGDQLLIQITKICPSCPK